MLINRKIVVDSLACKTVMPVRFVKTSEDLLCFSGQLFEVSASRPISFIFHHVVLHQYLVALLCLAVGCTLYSIYRIQIADVYVLQQIQDTDSLLVPIQIQTISSDSSSNIQSEYGLRHTFRNRMNVTGTRTVSDMLTLSLPILVKSTVQVFEWGQMQIRLQIADSVECRFSIKCRTPLPRIKYTVKSRGYYQYAGYCNTICKFVKSLVCECFGYQDVDTNCSQIAAVKSLLCRCRWNTQILHYFGF